MGLKQETDYGITAGRKRATGAVTGFQIEAALTQK